MVVVAGPNGSGKTTLTRRVLQHQWTTGHVYINADEIAEQELGGWNSIEAVREAARLADQRREACLAAGRDFAYETVFSTRERIAFVEKAKAARYFVRIYFVGTADPVINIRRVQGRVARGGHDVPTDKIETRFHRSVANLRLVLPIADRVYVFDNSIDRQPAKRWVRTRDGQIVKVADGDVPAWIEDAVTTPASPGNQSTNR